MKLFIDISKTLFTIIIGLLILLCYCLLALVFYRIVEGEMAVYNIMLFTICLSGILVCSHFYLLIVREEILVEENCGEKNIYY